ncbi:hypothetical protein DFH08DRAFT_1085929 [Mycena albidolilacea]|uniref:Autophagy-related protein 27 n=1 Tax=Mycena albidolilacea TaxID=1033008 RepID=A0AAD7EH74_9AGAR|nr:hypothetical protein DFH08DRAFT_1085929 [Mycena albidolilacea]
MTARRRLTWLALGLSLATIAAADEKPCTGRHAGKYYDLNPLAGKDYQLKTPEGHKLVLSVCKSVSHETWALKVEDPGLVGGFVRRAHGDFSLGQKNTTLSFPASVSPGRAVHPHLTLASGSKCRDSNGDEIDNLRGSTEIEFICDPSVAVGAASAVGAGSDLGVNVHAGGPRLVAQLPPGDDEAGCAWVFEWRTAAACPTSEGVTFGGVIWFLFVSTLTLLALYLVLGTLYNYFALGLSGTDALPRFTLAGAVYHGREAWETGRGWWEGRGSGFSSARGPVGLGGPGGFPTRIPPSNRDAEGGARSFGGADSANPNKGPERRAFGNGTTGSANPFIRTSTSVRHERPQGQQPQGLNPASHQAQVMAAPPGAALGAAGVPVPAPPPAESYSVMGSAPPGDGYSVMGSGPPPPPTTAQGLNPASHQAQVMAAATSPAPAQQTEGNVVAPAPARRDTAQTFAVGDDEEEGEEIQVADVRGRGSGAGESGIRL